MIRIKDIQYYCITALIFISLKFAFAAAENVHLTFLTLPSSKAVSMVTHSSGEFDSAMGFIHKDIGITIDKSCSGFNFLMLCFIVFQFRLMGLLRGRMTKVLSIPLVLLLSYFLTVFANSSRILSSIWLNRVLPIQYEWLHEAEGAFVYLFLFVSFYVASNHFTHKLKLKYAEPA